MDKIDSLLDVVATARDLYEASVAMNCTGDNPRLDADLRSIYMNQSRQIIRNHLRTLVHLGDSTYATKSFNRCRGSHRKQEAIKLGQNIAKWIAQTHKHAYMTRHIDTDQEFFQFNNLMAYLGSYNLSNEASYKIMPSYYDAQNKFTDRTWEYVPVEELGMFHYGYATRVAYNNAFPLHQLHISTEDRTQIAYYPTLKHMIEKREVRTKLGRYLSKYASYFQLDESQIKRTVDRFNDWLSGVKGWELRFIDHNDPDGWVNVYANGPSSCMHGEDCVKVYAHEHSVLRLAYLVDINTDSIIARSIVRDDDEKGWLRVYPDPNSSTQGRFLLDALNAQGYTDRTNLDGALLQYIEGSYGVVCPYIDAGSGGDQSVGQVYRHGRDYLEVGRGDMGACQTNGYAEGGCTCDECGDNVSEDDTTYIDHCDQRVCEHCRDYHYTYARGRRGSDYYPNDDVILCESDGEHYVEEYAGFHDVYQCTMSGNWYKLEDMDCFEGEYYHQDEMVRIDHYYRDNDRCEDVEYIPRTYKCTLSDGTTCHEDDEERYQAEIDADLIDEENDPRI